MARTQRPSLRESRSARSASTGASCSASRGHATPSRPTAAGERRAKPVVRSSKQSSNERLSTSNQQPNKPTRAPRAGSASLAARSARRGRATSAKRAERSDNLQASERSSRPNRGSDATRTQAKRTEAARTDTKRSQTTRTDAKRTQAERPDRPKLRSPRDVLDRGAQWLFDLRLSGKIALGLAATVAVLFGFFYQPSADLWAAHRDHDHLLAQKAELEQVSSDLEEDIAALRTEEGVADEARVRGYAPAGEEAADARALVGDDGDEIVQVLSEVAEEDPSEEPTYVQVLDAFFGYQPRMS